MQAREPKPDELEVRLPGSCQRTDEDIAAAAVSALRSNVLAPADKIKVDVVNSGKVVLRGSVRSWAEREEGESGLSWLGEPDLVFNAVGCRDVGEIGITGVAATIGSHPPLIIASAQWP
ncbi:BON domain-containing protein [Sorangium sp. So ce321]|uniref:BON domain-containing protein n=1 Tax=Sorangium sp. So ce321 TaxID=3133300 RepID=UPI003F63E731